MLHTSRIAAVAVRTQNRRIRCNNGSSAVSNSHAAQYSNAWYNSSNKSNASGNSFISSFQSPAETTAAAAEPQQPAEAAPDEATGSLIDEIVTEDDDAVIARQFCDRIYSSAGFASLDSWYHFKLTPALSQSTEGQKLRRYSPLEILCMAYPNHQWLPWRFPVLPRGYFRSELNRRAFFDWLYTKLKLTNGMQGWYGVSADQIRENGGAKILKYSAESVPFAIMNAFPEYSWHPWKFKAATVRIWQDRSVAAKFFRHIEKDLKINSFEDWYSIEPVEISARGGRLLITKRFKGDMYDALSFAFPNHRWEIWRFRDIGKHHFGDKKNQYIFMERMQSYIAEKLGKPKSLNLLYELTGEEVSRLGGRRFLKYYGQNWFDACMALYPDHNWNLLNFADFKRPMSGTAAAMAPTKPSLADLNATSSSAIADSVGSLLDAIDEPSDQPSESALDSVDVAAKPLTGADLLRKFIEDAAKALRLTSVEGWYSVEVAEILKHPSTSVVRMRHLLPSAGSLPALLKRAYPDHEWDANKFVLKVSKKRLMERLAIVLDVLFPGVPRKTAYAIKGAKAEDGVVLDVFIPSLNLVFRATPAAGRKGPDPQKVVDYCKNSGFPLVHVPVGWDLLPDSLRQMILEVKPDAFDALPAPPVPPASSQPTTAALSN